MPEDSRRRNRLTASKEIARSSGSTEPLHSRRWKSAPAHRIMARMKRLLLVIVVWCAFCQRRERLPATVTPGPQPSDAMVLFDGRDLAQWQRTDGTPSGCVVDGGEMLCRTGSGDAVSRLGFRDAQIHLEFKIPYMPAEHGQSRGNSGVYLRAARI